MTIDADLWSHFGSAEAVNDALRRVVADGKAERDEDFETHVRVAEALARTAPFVHSSSKKPGRRG